MPEASLTIHDMAGCYPPAIQKALHKIEGVTDAYANPVTEIATVTWDADRVSLTQTLERFQRSAYKAHCLWMRFETPRDTGSPPSEFLSDLAGVLFDEAGPAPGEHRVLVHPGEADLHKVRARLEEAGYGYLGTEDPG